jgi:hypothetical protein
MANDVSHASDLRVAARWLVGASASVVTVLVAAIQLQTFGNLRDVGEWAVVIALVAILTALTSVGWTLYCASAVLAVPRRSIRELAELDHADHGSRAGARVDLPETPLIRYLVIDRQLDLLGTRDAIWKVIRDRGVADNAALNPESGGEVQIGGHDYKLDDPMDSAALAGLTADLGRRATEIVDAAVSFETQRRYNRLAKGLRIAGAPFVLSILAFLWLQTFPHALANVQDPVNVLVVTPASAGTACGGKVLQGVAVGGTMDAPIVVLPAQGTCPARRISDTGDYVVIPQVGK